MWINSVELRNIKSYKHETISFKCGVNGISGENGAGKTTIIESVGSVLFNYQPPRHNRYFLRKGEKSGEIRLWVVASDDVEYEIVRSIKKSGSGEYRITSPTGQIVGSKDVQDWIAANLFDDTIHPEEISPLFENAVGVPQGMFTSAFGSPPRTRKEVFDRILRVDEYRKAFENLNDVSRIVRSEMEEIEKKHHELKGGTAKYDEFKERHEHERIRVSEIKKNIMELKKDLKQLQLKKDDLSKRKKLIDSTEKEIEKLEVDIKELKSHIDIVNRQLEESLNAKRILDETRDAKEKYLESQKKLVELSDERKKKNHLERQMMKKDNMVKNMEKELEKKKNLLEELETHQKELKDLSPMVKEQEELENEIKDIEDWIRDIISLKSDIDNLKKEDASFETLSKDLKELEEQQKEIELDVNKQKEFESKKQIITGKKSAINSEIKNIQKKKEEIGETNQCPILYGVKCTEVTSFSDYFENKLNNKIRELNSIENELKLVEGELKKLNNPMKRMEQNKYEISNIKGQLKRKSDVQHKLHQYESKMVEFHKTLSEKYASYLIPGEPELHEKMEKIKAVMETRLKELNNPKQQASNIDALMNARMRELNMIKIDGGALQLEKSRLFDIKLRLSEFSDIDSKEREIKKIMHDCEPYYRKYLQNEAIAGKIDPHQHKCDELNLEISKRISEKDRLLRNLDEYKPAFDCEEFERITRKHEAKDRDLSSKNTEYNVISKNLEQLKKDLLDMESLIRKKERLRGECESKKGFLSYIEFVRNTLKDSAQLIAGRLIENIGKEANRIYCEIINDYTQELRWTHDYAIIVTEHGEEKEFNQLCGGEQMSSSLAVRFALLKVLSGCDVVFLDEPTQNMDEIRREKLSEQILNISGFKQIFVISHDDTFNEKYENVIRVEKIDGESRVASGGVIS
ncbi:MAG: AAA family ATPase [Euryarchaeota archaeon]|nr:AAA family ATPase [Euryarchaeota archaeon]